MTTIFVTVVACILTFLVVYFRTNLIRRNSIKKDTTTRPPCLPTLPLVGSLPFVPSASELHIFLHKKTKDLGNVIAMYMCNRMKKVMLRWYVVVLHGIEVIQEALLKQSRNLADRPQFYLSNLLKDDKGYISHPYNDDFKKLHRLSLNILKTFGFGHGIMENRIRIEAENMLQRFGLKNGQAFNPQFETTASVSNVICSLVFGRRWNLDDPEFREGLDIIRLQFEDLENVAMIDFFPVLRFFPKFRDSIKHQLKLRERWHNYIIPVLEGIDSEKAEDSFYKVLKKKLEAGVDAFNKTEIKERLFGIVKDFLVAGTETTASTFQWFIIFMANNQDIQKQVRDEIDQVVGLDRHPSLDDKPNLPLMEATLLEVMRLRTLVPLALGHLTMKDVHLNGMFIPANTVVFPNLYSCHMDPTVWKEPEKFDISRFLDETKTKVVNKEQIIPFSLGKRSCLGEMLARQEIFLFASALVHEFEIHPPIGQDRIDDSEKVAVVNAPKRFEARFIRRPRHM